VILKSIIYDECAESMRNEPRSPIEPIIKNRENTGSPTPCHMPSKTTAKISNFQVKNLYFAILQHKLILKTFHNNHLIFYNN